MTYHHSNHARKTNHRSETAHNPARAIEAVHTQVHATCNWHTCKPQRGPSARAPYTANVSFRRAPVDFDLHPVLKSRYIFHGTHICADRVYKCGMARINVAVQDQLCLPKQIEFLSDFRQPVLRQGEAYEFADSLAGCRLRNVTLILCPPSRLQQFSWQVLHGVQHALWGKCTCVRPCLLRRLSKGGNIPRIPLGSGLSRYALRL